MGTRVFEFPRHYRLGIAVVAVCTALAFLPGVTAAEAAEYGNMAGLVAADRVDIDHDWRWVNFPAPFAEAPIVVAGPASWVGRDPTTVQVRGVSATGFAIRLKEWPYLDGYHTFETVSYLAVPAGRHILPSGVSVEAGTSTVAAGGSEVRFADSFVERPVLLAVVESSSPALAVRTDVGNSGFSVRLDAQEADAVSPAAAINWVAWSAASDGGASDGVPWETHHQSINNTFTQFTFDRAYGTPCILAGMNTLRGGDPASLRYRNVRIDGVEMRVDEERSEDAETAHVAESIGMLVMECDSPVAPKPIVVPDFAFGHTFASGPVVLSGIAADYLGVARVIVGIFDRNRDLWLQNDLSSWGSFSVTDATVDAAGQPRTRWSISLDLADGDYSLMARSVNLIDTHAGEVAPYRHFSIGTDSTPPIVDADFPAGTEFTNPVLLSGMATDDTGVERVRLAVRDRVTKLWLQSDEASWGSTYHGFSPSTAIGLDTTSVTWTLGLTLPEGHYNLSARARDWTGNWFEMAPWREFSVAGPAARRFVDSGQSLGSDQTMRVGVGDLDGDDDLDVLTANGVDRPNLVWINDGAAGFSDSGQRLGASWSWGVDLGDVDDDGDLDAFVANYVYGQPNMVWLNDGSAGFADSGQRLGDRWSLSVALADLDGNDSLDAFVGNYQPNRIWLNGGDGVFEDSGQEAGPWINATVALGDLDDDGDLDAFLANHGWSYALPNHVLFNDGSGLMTDSGQYLGDETTLGAALADLDGDGDLDAFTANHDANFVWVNDGSGTFADSGQRLGTQDSISVALGDVDGDGDVDAFVGNYGGDRIWLNDGTGSFFSGGLLLGALDAVDVALADLDGDGDLDAWVGNNGGNMVWLNTTN